MQTSKDSAQKTKARLRGYELFSDETIRVVAEVAGQQARYKHYDAFFKDIGIPEPKLHYFSKHRAVPVVDVPPRTATKSMQKSKVLVMHLPMGNPLDANQLYQVATIAATLPDYRIVAFGNPSGSPYRFRQQGRGLVNLWRIAFGSNKRSLVAGELDYLATQKIEEVHHLGYSFGAHKALLTSLYSEGAVDSLTLIDPVAHSRYAQQLLGDFQRTFQPLGEYVSRTGIESYFEARKATHHVRYNAGLMRPINIAIGFMLSRLDFIPLVKNVLHKQPHASLVVAWGSASELGNTAHLQANLHTITHKYPRARSYRLEGDTHTFANDIHLHAAIVYEAIT